MVLLNIQILLPENWLFMLVSIYDNDGGDDNDDNSDEQISQLSGYCLCFVFERYQVHISALGLSVLNEEFCDFPIPSSQI